MQSDGSVTLATWVAAIAAVAAALVAGVQVVREMHRELVRSRGAHARMETIAYQLRRQLRAWVGPPTGNVVEIEKGEGEFEDWIRKAQNARTYGEQLDRAEQRFDSLMALQPDAAPQVSRALNRAYIYFLEGTRRLNEYAAERPGNDRLWEWIQLRTDAEKDLRDCISQLERHVLGAKVEAERDLTARREAENPLAPPRRDRLSPGSEAP